MNKVCIKRMVLEGMIGLLLFTMLGCTPKKKEIKIGAILPLTGPLSFIGELDRNGLNLAMEQINSKRKSSPIRVLIQDNQGKAEKTVSIFQMFLNVEKIGIVFIPTTTPNRAVLPIADKNNILQIALCMDPTIQKDSRMTFRLYEGMNQEAETILKYFEKIRKAKVAILYVRHPGTEQEVNNWLVPGLHKMGLDVVAIEPYLLTDKDFKPVIAKIKNSGATHLIIIGYGFLYPQIFMALKEQRLLGKIKIVGGWGFIAPNKTPPDLLEGVVVAAPEYVFQKNEKVKVFIRKYKERYGREPNFEAAFAYNALMMVTSAIDKASSPSSVQVAKALPELGSFDGILGTVSLSKSGEMKLPMGIGIFKNGKVVPYLKSKH